MNTLICDSGPLIASFNPGDHYHQRCVRLLANWPGKLLIPEPVLGETCNFLRNHVRNGRVLESRFLDAATTVTPAFEIIAPTLEDRRRAAVDRHGHLDVAVSDDVPDDVRRNAEVEQQRHAGMPGVVEPDLPEADGISDPAPAPAEVARLQRSAKAGQEDQPVVLPARSGRRSFGLLAFLVLASNLAPAYSAPRARLVRGGGTGQQAGGLALARCAR